MKKLILILALFALIWAQETPSAQNTNTNDAATQSRDSITTVLNYIDSPLVDIIWCGEKKNVLFLLTEKSTLYRSVDEGFSGHRLTEHLQKLGKQELGGSSDKVGQVSRIQQSPVDKSMIIFLGTEGVNWFTENCGESFKAMNQGRRIEEFQFHPTEKNWILASAWTVCEDFLDEPCRRYKELYISKDLGNQWEPIGEYIFQFSWAHVDATFINTPKERIMVVRDPMGKGHQTLGGWNAYLETAYSDDFFKTTKAIVKGGNKFLLTTYFMFVVQVHSDDSKEITLLVGDPKEKSYILRAIELPVKRLLEHSYTILDTSEHSVFLHINHEGDSSRYGNVYVSDSTGVRYSLALNGNIRNADGQCDFERIQGLEGIYLANVYEKEAIKRLKNMDFSAFPQQHPGVKKTSDVSNETPTMMNSLFSNDASQRTLDDFKKTLVSFDKGGIWQTLTPPLKDSTGKRIICNSEEECSLHLHSISNTNFGPFYTTENSMGIVLGTGNVGKYLSNRPDEINTYLSRDGGLTWFEIAQGSHIYEVGDHGSILVIAPDQHATTYVRYSWNEGLTWENLIISDTPIEVKNIIIEPTNTAEKFLIYGRSADVTQRGVVVAVDFTPLHQKWCKGYDKPDTPESDYETWSPNGKISPHCLMGRQINFIRKKREAECFNSEEHEQWKFIKSCECTEEDWECDLGFTRVGSGPCLPIDDKQANKSRSVPEQCNAYYYITQGYRKVAGNSCNGGIDHNPIRLPCPGVSALNSKNLMVLVGLVSIVLGMVWLSKKGNSERVKAHLDDLYKKLRAKMPKSKGNAPTGFRTIDDIPDTLRDEEDFGRIVFEETEDKAEPIADENLFEFTQGKKMTERRGMDTASKYVPTLNKPGEKKSNNNLYGF